MCETRGHSNMMVRALVLILALGALACSRQPTDAPRPAHSDAATRPMQSPAPHALGPLHVGMTRAEVLSLGLPVATTTEEMEGDTYTHDAITLGNGTRIAATSTEGVVRELSTDTIGYATAEGGRVGDSLSVLQHIYPQGEIAKGIGEAGRYFIFMTGREVQSFEFDTTDLSRDCLVNNRDCPADLETRRSTAFNVR